MDIVYQHRMMKTCNNHNNDKGNIDSYFDIKETIVEV